MRKLLKFLSILFLGVICCACMNTVAVHELNQKAAQYLQSGDVDVAISRLEASVDLDANVYESRYNLAAAYMQKHECKKALEHIKVALDLQKNEPAVYYTHGVAAVCVADSLLEKVDENGDIVPIQFDSNDAYLQAVKNYVALLKEANDSFDKYTKMAPMAEDTQQIIALMRENGEKIEKNTAIITEQ